MDTHKFFSCTQEDMNSRAKEMISDKVQTTISSSMFKLSRREADPRTSPLLTP